MTTREHSLLSAARQLALTEANLVDIDPAATARALVAVEQARLHVKELALLFTAEQIRESGERGTLAMADYVESLVVNVRDGDSDG